MPEILPPPPFTLQFTILIGHPFTSEITNYSRRLAFPFSFDRLNCRMDSLVSCPENRGL
uniref:Uncharacterized protein n=2 Tax=Picea TaxID=3328 RepID=A0A101M104_PICGL|nr:hypothetical protein ABT39_MTgene4373 [Picea glauca]QHR91788.1 hypothetical protein Q903MT_gene5824 [Picea sitchensis]